jgi:hypothetical protein
VCYVKVYNTFLNSKGKGIRKRKDKEDKLSKSQSTWKNKIRPFTFKTHFFSFLICFETSKKLWMHQLELYKTSFNSKTNIIMSKDLKFHITNCFTTSPTLTSLIWDPVFSSFLVSFWWFSWLQVHEVGLYNISLNSKGNSKKCPKV